jgi:hypothetical protein
MVGADHRYAIGTYSLRTTPCKMHDQGDERDDQENVNQASGDVEDEPAKNQATNRQ